MSGEPEPRRSVRATKGQHTKTFDQLDAPIEPPKRRGATATKNKRTKKTAATTTPEASASDEEEDELIRCICGATEQDEDSGETWICCDKCGAWQHNVCMGMSEDDKDLPEHYYCERCRPQEHKALLEGMARGEKPWEAWRAAHEEKKKTRKGKKGGGRGRGKRASDVQAKEAKEQKEKEAGAEADEASAANDKASPAPDASKTEKGKKDPKSTTGKRKNRDESHEEGAKAQKQQKTERKPSPLAYVPPADLPEKHTELPDNRQGPAKLLAKYLTQALNAALKKKTYKLAEGKTVEMVADRHALRIERAAFDSHAAPKDYANQCRTLALNLARNEEVAADLFNGLVTPTALAVMTSDELASRELREEVAKMRARSHKQSILITDDGPRVRRTHKGEEFIESDNEMNADEETPTFAPRSETDDARKKSSASQGSDTGPGSQRPSLSLDTQQSPQQSNFNIGDVFSNLKTDPNAHRRPSGGTSLGPRDGPGHDPDIDRLLHDDDGGTESPPYSPTEDNDPDVVWRGHLVMNSMADMPATMKFAAGANLHADGVVRWDQLVPRRLAVAGRIDNQKAIEYLCGLRYQQHTDVVVASLHPAAERYKPDFDAVFRYFVGKGRYGVVGDKGVANVRDTYLVPVLPGTGNVPEFLLNLATNLVPQERQDPMLLVVFVYRDEMGLLRAAQQAGLNSADPTSAQGGNYTPSLPALPAGQSFPSPVPPSPAPAQAGTPATPTAAATQQTPAQAEKIARDILGPLVYVPTVQFLLPMAGAMTSTEWEIVRDLLNKDHKARDDLQYLSKLIENHGKEDGVVEGERAARRSIAGAPATGTGPAGTGPAGKGKGAGAGSGQAV